jgi:hypothetical protein
MKKQQPQPPFGNLTRRITIAIDDSGRVRIDAMDYMVMGKAVFLALPSPQPTDSRHVLLVLTQAVHNYAAAMMTALVLPEQIVETRGDNGATPE